MCGVQVSSPASADRVVMSSRFRYRAFGDASERPPVLVVPGLGVSRYLVRACNDLASRCGHQVLLANPPGFGENAALLDRPITVAAVADAYGSWLAQRGPVFLVGQSTGTIVAARVA